MFPPTYPPPIKTAGCEIRKCFTIIPLFQLLESRQPWKDNEYQMNENSFLNSYRIFFLVRSQLQKPLNQEPSPFFEPLKLAFQY